MSHKERTPKKHNEGALGKLIDSFDGIKTYIYAGDHHPPHFHAYYAEYSAIFRIDTLEMMDGDMPAKQRKRVHAWAVQRRGDLKRIFMELNPH